MCNSILILKLRNNTLNQTQSTFNNTLLGLGEVNRYFQYFYSQANVVWRELKAFRVHVTTIQTEVHHFN